MATQQKKPGAPESSSSYESSESDDEETAVVSKQPETKPQVPEGEDGDEGEEDDEDTDSNSEGAGQYDTLRRDMSSVSAAVAAKPADNLAGKRVRDANGGKGVPAEEPANKKKKEGKDEKPRAQPVKGASSAKVEKVLDKAVKGSKVVKGKPVAAAKAENGKPAGAARRRKASSPASGRGRGDTDKSSPLKSTAPKASKKPIQWSAPQEIALSNILLKEFKNNGVRIPNSKSDPFWEKLMKQLPLEGDLTELQLSDKVRRMRQRHSTLKDRMKEDGETLQELTRREAIQNLGRGLGTSQPPDEEEESGDESAGTATPAGMIAKATVLQSKGGDDESSTEEDEEDQEVDDLKRKTAGLNEINAGDAAGKSAPLKAISTPFISKPKLEFTPIAKEDKRKPLNKGGDVISLDQPGDEALAPSDGTNVDLTSLTNEHMKNLKAETASFLQEIRRSCFQLVEEICGDRLGSMLGSGQHFLEKGLWNTSLLDGLISSSGGQEAQELQRKWREHRVQELALLSKRLQLQQEQCRLQQEELKLQNQKLGSERGL